MAKSLSARIAERATRQKPSRSAQNRATFLALKADIKEALDDGWPVKTVWETLHEEGKVTFSYQAFRGYANRLILGNQAGPEGSRRAGELASTPASAEGGAGGKPAASPPAVAPTPAATGFTFNAKPDKQELL